jgi:hypothetical protein
MACGRVCWLFLLEAGAKEPVARSAATNDARQFRSSLSMVIGKSRTRLPVA